MSRGKSEDGADAALWQKIISQTSPLDKRHKSRQIARAVKPSATKKRTAGHSEKPIRATASRLNQAAKPNAKPAPAPQPEVTIEHKARRRLSRGHLEIEARLDLHGMTAAQAKAILTQFIYHSVGRGLTWVLVITGKGVAGQGILRRELPLWCAQPPLSQNIVSLGPAASSHGGDGAFYMRLRKQRG